jgi:hypothetical protein
MYSDLYKLGVTVDQRFVTYNNKSGTQLFVDLQFRIDSFLKHSLRQIKHPKLKEIENSIKLYLKSLDKETLQYLSSLEHQASARSLSVNEIQFIGATPELGHYIRYIYNIVYKELHPWE